MDILWKLSPFTLKGPTEKLVANKHRVRVRVHPQSVVGCPAVETLYVYTAPSVSSETIQHKQLEEKMLRWNKLANYKI